MLELTVGLDGRDYKSAQKLLQKSRKDLLSLDVKPERLITGYETGTDKITLRILPASRYAGGI